MVATQFNKEMRPELCRRLLRKHGLNARISRRKPFVNKKNKVSRLTKNLLTKIILSGVQHCSPMKINFMFF